jgi:hypothetical protein
MTLSALGIFSAAGAGGAPAGAYELIETYILGSAQPSVTFSSLGTYSSTYKHLQLRMTLRQDTNANEVRVRLNGDAGSNYRTHFLEGTGSAVNSSGYAATYAGGYYAAASGDIANVFGAAVLDLLDPYSTTKNKTLRNLGGHAGSFDSIFLTSNLWINTASLTSIEILAITSNWVSGSRFSLYGIKG